MLSRLSIRPAEKQRVMAMAQQLASKEHEASIWFSHAQEVGRAARALHTLGILGREEAESLASTSKFTLSEYLRDHAGVLRRVSGARDALNSSLNSLVSYAGITDPKSMERLGQRAASVGAGVTARQFLEELHDEIARARVVERAEELERRRRTSTLPSVVYVHGQPIRRQTTAAGAREKGTVERHGEETARRRFITKVAELLRQLENERVEALDHRLGRDTLKQIIRT